MNRKTLICTAFLTSGLLLTGCTAANVATPQDSAPQDATQSESAIPTGDLTPATVMAANADYTTLNTDEWNEAQAVDIQLTGSNASSSDAGVTVTEGTITITAGGTYRFSGAFEGKVVVAAPDDAAVTLILDGVALTNPAGAAIEVQSADDVAIHLAAGSTNTVSDAPSYADDAEANSAIFADTDLTISGTGSLAVTGNGGHGIKSTDDLVILGGTITVAAAEDALRGKDALVVEGGTLHLSSTNGDGMKSNGDEGDADIDWTSGYLYVSGGTIDISAGDDGLQAFTDTVIAGGTVSITAADDGVKGDVVVSIGTQDGISEPQVTVTTSLEAIESANIGISGGVIDVTASDDGVNASGNAELQALIAGQEYVAGGQGEFTQTGERLVVTGGSLTVDAEGDGLDSNGTITITGGDTIVYGPTQGGNGSIDANGDITVTGGTLLTFGPNSMEQSPSTDGQGWVIVAAQLTAGQSAQLVDNSGTVVAKFTAKKHALNIIYSTAAIQAAATYTVTSNGESLGSAVAGEGGLGGGMPGGGMPDGEGPGGDMPDGEMPSGEGPGDWGGERPEGQMRGGPGGTTIVPEDQ